MLNNKNLWPKINKNLKWTKQNSYPNQQKYLTTQRNISSLTINLSYFLPLLPTPTFPPQQDAKKPLFLGFRIG